MYVGSNDGGIDKAMGKHARLYGDRVPQRVNWDDYISEYPEPWVPCYYKQHADAEPGPPAFALTVNPPDTNHTVGTEHWHFAVMSDGLPRKVIGSLIVSEHGVAIEGEP